MTGFKFQISLSLSLVVAVFVQVSGHTVVFSNFQLREADVER